MVGPRRGIDPGWGPRRGYMVLEKKAGHCGAGVWRDRGRSASIRMGGTEEGPGLRGRRIWGLYPEGAWNIGGAGVGVVTYWDHGISKCT